MLTFLIQGLRRQHEVGTILPSSRWLARAMTDPIRQAPGPKRVLEVGPGTGAFTSQLLPLLRDGDSVHIVECNPVFCRLLETRVLEPFRRRNPGVDVVLHRQTIETAPLERGFDFIVCSLPFKVFKPQEVRAIFRRLMRLLAADGQLTYMEYAGVRVFKAPLLTPSRRRELLRVEAISRTLPRRHRSSRKLIWLNVLPAFAVRLAHDEGIEASRPRGTSSLLSP